MRFPRKSSASQKGGIPSPCISVCTLDDDTGLCKGCLRSDEEIARWLRMSDAEKTQVLENIARRRETIGDSLL